MTISLPKELAALLDARAAEVGLNRSEYIRQVLRQDLAKGGNLIIRPSRPGKL